MRAGLKLKLSFLKLPAFACFDEVLARFSETAPKWRFVFMLLVILCKARFGMDSRRMLDNPEVMQQHKSVLQQ
jgi:hypothetical protein